MARAKQRATAKRSIKKATRVAKKKRTISKLPKRTRTALAKRASAVKRRKAG